ncbi:ribbon-helix-helix protein, CopG family [Arthrospira platensis]|uniref:ribbon-helix-helix protein, CopG family n=1 Tax=Limnospira TaxID=2596745 RepID=UPI0002920446|nr:ribbon-helix-helix protein, CopG family [Arthrospira platensis]KDR58458.1 CopG family transcriptional regulator [Arthrospira platensis str. Paraca]MBD2670088.1 ribbon-helix-helix protein, CopG family [Arthrospira platensis FACHB-439]MBD2710559.1 ribbon-helix-helix protein, CopG family [Arthrospira platensis FACHB-835]MDT9310321.1 ribbon-helix-helix protein, CopG family [Limnospira sp. Paracas R14]QQW30122.1 ribbon-helix-helix protein, CopG family [Arthrospira sp. PCC 9108]
MSEPMSTPNDITLTVTVSQELMQEIEQKSQENGHSITQLVQEAIREYLTPNNATDIELLRRQIIELQRQLLSWEKIPKDLTAVETRVGILERRLGSLSVTNQRISLPSIAEDDEDFYDEPDEILTDFLSD